MSSSGIEEEGGECRLLLIAAKEGNVEAVRWLVEHGADPRRRDSKGRTALFLAVAGGKGDVVAYLLPLMAASSPPDINGWGLTHAAVLSAKKEILQKVCQFGRLDDRSDRGTTPLMLAANLGLSEIVCWLLDAGATVEARDLEGWTALHHAAWSGTQDALPLLLRKIPVDAPTSLGRTPLALAVERGHYIAARMLLEAAACPLTTDSHGQTPASIATSNGSMELVKLITSYTDLHVSHEEDTCST